MGEGSGRLKGYPGEGKDDTMLMKVILLYHKHLKPLTCIIFSPISGQEMVYTKTIYIEKTYKCHMWAKTMVDQLIVINLSHGPITMHNKDFSKTVCIIIKKSSLVLKGGFSQFLVKGGFWSTQ
jgi:hypothetical protein